MVVYATAEMDVRAVDADTGERVPSGQGDADLLVAPPSGQRSGPTRSPDDRSIAAVRPARRGTELVLTRDGGRARVLFSARGRLTGPTWSPDGRWLLVGWPAADQWLFIPVERDDSRAAGEHGGIVAFDGIAEQFDPGGTDAAEFPRVAGWVLPER